MWPHVQASSSMSIIWVGHLSRMALLIDSFLLSLWSLLLGPSGLCCFASGLSLSASSGSSEENQTTHLWGQGKKSGENPCIGLRVQGSISLSSRSFALDGRAWPHAVWANSPTCNLCFHMCQFTQQVCTHCSVIRS